MKTKTQDTKPAGTRELLEEAATNLHGHRGSGSYYGSKKAGGNRRVHALRTTDRKVAERKLAEWIKGIAETDATAANLTLGGLFARYSAPLIGKPKTIETKETMLRLFERTFERGMGIPLCVASVVPAGVASRKATGPAHAGLGRAQAGRARSFPYLGNTPTVRWNDGDGDFDAVIGWLLREVQRTEHFKHYVESLKTFAGIDAPPTHCPIRPSC